MQSALTETHTASLAIRRGGCYNGHKAVIIVSEIYQLEQLLAFAECGTCLVLRSPCTCPSLP